ncbi:hypothetical protein Barb6_03632 [Bacteroidales bacterium Barb6]|nr:hypothetical protein Barb6_03632 [Bacteroidales bacterium Barb6]
MDSLIKQMVAAQPFDVKPVADVIFHIAPFGTFALVPPRPLIPMGGSRNNIAYQSVLHLYKGFPIVAAVTALVAGHNGETLARSHFGGSNDGTDTGRVNGTGLFHKDMLARFHSRLEVFGAEMGRRAEQDKVNLLHRQHLRISIKAEEAVGIVHFVVELFAQHLPAGIHPVGEQINQRNNRHIVARFEELRRRTRPPVAATHECRLQRLAVGRNVRKGKHTQLFRGKVLQSRLSAPLLRTGRKHGRRNAQRDTRTDKRGISQEISSFHNDDIKYKYVTN